VSVLTGTTFRILLALAEGPLHGSAIARAVLDQTGGELRLWPVKLYSTLDQLAGEGLIREAVGQERPIGQSERRRYYRVTAAGRAALAREADRMVDLARATRATLARHGS
jgi:PadR family transcriptional regulator PadR